MFMEVTHSKMVNLEVGCGKRQVAQNSIGIDIDKTSHCDVVADAHFLPFRNNVFDKTILFEVCEHLDDPKKALMEIARVSSKVLISVPNVYWLRRLLRWIVKGEGAVSPEHIYGWTLLELKNLLSISGFEIESIDFFDTHFAGENILKLLLPFLPRRITKQSLFIIGIKGCGHVV